MCVCVCGGGGALKDCMCSLRNILLIRDILKQPVTSVKERSVSRVSLITPDAGMTDRCNRTETPK